MDDDSINDFNNLDKNIKNEMTLLIGSCDEESFFEPGFIPECQSYSDKNENTDPFDNCRHFNSYNHITSPTNDIKLKHIENLCYTMKNIKENNTLGCEISLETIKETQKNILNLLQNRLTDLVAQYHEDLSELSYIQSGSSLINLYKWRQAKPYDLMLALRSGSLDNDDLKAVNDFMNGKLSQDMFFPFLQYSSNKTKNQMFLFDMTKEQDSDDDDDDDKYLDETKILRVAEEEISVLKRIEKLKKLGLWSFDTMDESFFGSDAPSMSALAATNEPELPRTHSSYLYAELRWLAEDYARERQWKKASAKKLAYAALKAYREKTERSFKAEREEIMRTRKMCAFISRMIRDWWRQMDKIVHAKHQVRLAAKRQKAMSSHLGRVLETTEEYTRWLTEGMTTHGSGNSVLNSKVNGEGEELLLVPNNLDTSLTNLNQLPKELTTCTSDSEALCKNTSLSLVVSGITDKVNSELCSESDSDSDQTSDQDSEFQGNDSDELDDEETIAKEEEEAALEAALATKSSSLGLSLPTDDSALQIQDTGEIELLAMEAMQPLEDLIPAGYLEALANLDSDGLCVSEPNSPAMNELQPISPIVHNSPKSTEDSKCSPNVLDDFVEPKSNSKPLPNLILQTSISLNLTDETKPSEELASSSILPETVSDQRAVALRNLTAEAMSAQPTGVTSLPVSSALTQPTPAPTVPFLLTGTLREYQLVGLGWLSAIYTKRLNGILADEMGLGKTIQTIALLAQLACDQAVWGPHLIVVPTSVMLNWEMEFKRWCPGFKIITYFGSLRERKEKRKVIFLFRNL